MNKILPFDFEKKWDYENGFYVTSPVERIGKLLAHYELYKKIIDLPGNIVECGVFKAASLIRFASFRNILETNYSRKIIGFDNFGEFPVHDEEKDTEFINMFETLCGDGFSLENVNEIFKYKKIENYELIKGNIIETIPQYMDSHPEMRISLLHLDVDVYEASKVILNNFYDRVVKNGIIIFDDYGCVRGATVAAEEFFENKDVFFNKLQYCSTPTYIIKK